MPNKPTTVPQLDTNQSNRTIPAASKVSDGYLTNDLLPAANANYLWGWAGDWLGWLDATFEDGDLPGDVRINGVVGIEDTPITAGIGKKLNVEHDADGTVNATAQTVAIYAPTLTGNRNICGIQSWAINTDTVGTYGGWLGAYWGTVAVNDSGKMTDADCFSGVTDVADASGQITGKACVFRAYDGTATGTIAEQYGLRVDALTAGDTQYGVWIGGVSSGESLHVDAGKVSLGPGLIEALDAGGTRAGWVVGKHDFLHVSTNRASAVSAHLFESVIEGSLNTSVTNLALGFTSRATSGTSGWASNIWSEFDGYASGGTTYQIFDCIASGIYNEGDDTITEGCCLHAYGGSNTGSGALTNLYGVKVDNINGGTNNYGVYVKNASTYAIWVDDGYTKLDGQVAIATDPDPLISLRAKQTFDAGVTEMAAYFEGSLTSALDGIALTTRSTMDVGLSSGTKTNAYNLYAQWDDDSSGGVITNGWNVYSVLSLNGGTLDKFANYRAYNGIVSGSIDNLYGFLYPTPSNAGSITSQYGIYIGILNQAANNYGLYVQAASPGYAIWVDSGECRFDGNVACGATNPDTPLHVWASDVRAPAGGVLATFEKNDACVLNILSSNAAGKFGAIWFGDADATATGRFEYYQDDDHFEWWTANGPRMELDATDGLVASVPITSPTFTCGASKTIPVNFIDAVPEITGALTSLSRDEIFGSLNFRHSSAVTFFRHLTVPQSGTITAASVRLIGSASHNFAIRIWKKAYTATAGTNATKVAEANYSTTPLDISSANGTVVSLTVLSGAVTAADTLFWEIQNVETTAPNLQVFPGSITITADEVTVSKS